MRELTKVECESVAAAAWFPHLNEDKDLVMPVAWGLAAVGGMIGGTLFDWKGLLVGIGVGFAAWPVGKEVFQGFPHLRKWFGKSEDSEVLDS